MLTSKYDKAPRSMQEATPQVPLREWTWGHNLWHAFWVSAPLLAAVASTLAAIFTGLTLFLSGRRERRKWIRESLLAAEIQFLDASFRYPAKRIYQLRRDGLSSSEAHEAFFPFYDDIHEVQNNALTQLRILAEDKVVRAAERLHAADEVLSRELLDGELPEVDEYQAMLDVKKLARLDFIAKSRKSKGLSRGVKIVSSSLRPVTRTLEQVVERLSRQHPSAP